MVSLSEDGRTSGRLRLRSLSLLCLARSTADNANGGDVADGGGVNPDGLADCDDGVTVTPLRDDSDSSSC